MGAPRSQETQSELKKVKTDLAAAESASAAAIVDMLRKARNRLAARIQALNFRWSELQTPPG